MTGFGGITVVCRFFGGIFVKLVFGPEVHLYYSGGFIFHLLKKLFSVCYCSVVHAPSVSLHETQASFRADIRPRVAWHAEM